MVDNPVGGETVVKVGRLLRPFIHDTWKKKALYIFSDEENNRYPKCCMLTGLEFPDLFGNAVLPGADDLVPFTHGIKTNLVTIPRLRGTGLKLR